MKYFRIVFVFLGLLLCLNSCNTHGEENRKNGILANADVVSSIRQKLEDRENSLLAARGDVFWTPTGSLWHTSYKCGYLSKSKTVYHGTVEQAKLEGKLGLCKRCASSSGDSVYETLDKNPVETDDVFFTRDGTEWHRDLNCPAILGAEHIYHSSKDVARALGKTGACSECED